jgi:hypothetical protein
MTVLSASAARYGIVASFMVGFGIIFMYAMVLNGGSGEPYHHVVDEHASVVTPRAPHEDLLQTEASQHRKIAITFDDFMARVKTQESAMQAQAVSPKDDFSNLVKAIAQPMQRERPQRPPPMPQAGDTVTATETMLVHPLRQCTVAGHTVAGEGAGSDCSIQRQAGSRGGSTGQVC